MANLKDMLEGIKTQLLAQKWPGGDSPVFAPGSVAITRGSTEAGLRTMTVPAALIMPGNMRSDPQFDEEPDLLQVIVVVRVLVMAPGDAIGQKPLVGANRPDATKSEGAGLLEVMEEVHKAIGKLNEGDDANFIVQFRQKGGSGGVHIDERVYWLYQDLEFEAWVTAT